MEQNLVDFANGYAYFGFHKTAEGWYYREWAPGADGMYLTGDFCNWDRYAHPMKKGENGEFALFLPGENALRHGQRVMAVVVRQGQELDRIPLYARYVTETDGVWNAEIWDTPAFAWTDKDFRPKRPLFIYECHIGMAQQEGRVGTYREFMEKILPRIKRIGYNAIQLMAVQEHPYYASFGYQVTNFFAPSSRFGTPDELKKLIDTAHKMGISVLLDLVHSHAAPNTREGPADFDGSEGQFFKAGLHPAWGTKCFDYGKEAVVHFLLSNLKYWQTEFHFDGFRFDGVTSMLYRDHGLYGAYGETDRSAVEYLRLATALAKQLDPRTVLIAEEVSALPGLCRPEGLGFDYRLAMGEPDLWIRLIKDVPDEDWDLNHIYYELTCRRPGEPVIGYCESHDQALVGDKTLMFRLCDSRMYTHMDKASDDPVIHRGMALHKIIRLLTMTLGGEGYLCFMGNEFGHPEWIDFPREGNNWSYHYCRRQWNLADNDDLRYGQLMEFDRDLIKLCKRRRLLTAKDRQLWLDNRKKILVYQKGKVLFAVNLHPTESYDGLEIPTPAPGNYKVIMSTDDPQYGGFGRIEHRVYSAGEHFKMYLPSRAAAVIVIEN